MHQELIQKAGAIIQKNTGAGTHCVLALTDLDGYPTASTITASKAEWHQMDYLLYRAGVIKGSANQEMQPGQCLL